MKRVHFLSIFTVVGVAVFFCASSVFAQGEPVTGLIQLTKDKNIDLFPNSSKTENRIVFESMMENIGKGGRNFEAVMMGQDGIAKRLTTEIESNNNVAFAKDDVAIIFDSFRQKKRGLWVKSLRVGGDQQISRGNTVDFDGDANAADGRIVFCSVDNKKNINWSKDHLRWFRAFKKQMPQIWLVNADGTGMTPLIKGINPTWSPDGKKIAFASNVNGNYEIYVIAPNGSGLVQLTSRVEPDIEPTWSPDGKKIAFTAKVNNDWNVWMMNADGSGLSQLTNNPAPDGGPTWGKDGFIYFHSKRSGNFDIWKFKPIGYEPIPPDTDKDGIADNVDKCPDQAEDKDGFQDEDGCSDPDNDGDKIPDADDKCPSEPETVNGYQEEDGCPDKNPMADKIVLMIDFIKDKQLAPSAYAQLENVLEKLRQTKSRIEIRSYTAAKGAEAKNMSITQTRADAVKMYFIERGIDASRLVAVGYGSTNPIASNQTADGRRQNNRIEIVALE